MTELYIEVKMSVLLGCSNIKSCFGSVLLPTNFPEGSDTL